MTAGSKHTASILLPVVLAAVALVDPAPSSPECVVGPLQGPETAKECGECHVKIYKEWQLSSHSRAWTNEVYRRKLKEKKATLRNNAEPVTCYNCHIPQAILPRVDPKRTRKPRRRRDPKTFHEGITCVSCHQKGGKIHGPYGTKTKAHPVEKNPVFTSKNAVQLCRCCHNTDIGPVLKVVEDFETSGLAAKGKSCTGCHMREVSRHIAVDREGNPVGKKRGGRGHDILGPGDPKFLASAFKLSTKQDGKDIEVVVANEAGHKVPALILRKFVFHVRQLNATGEELGNGKFELHHENLLEVLEKRHFPFALKAGVRKVEVRGEHVFEGKVVAEFLKTTLDL